MNTMETKFYQFNKKKNFNTKWGGNNLIPIL